MCFIIVKVALFREDYVALIKDVYRISGPKSVFMHELVLHYIQKNIVSSSGLIVPIRL